MDVKSRSPSITLAKKVFLFSFVALLFVVNQSACTALFSDLVATSIPSPTLTNTGTETRTPTITLTPTPTSTFTPVPTPTLSPTPPLFALESTPLTGKLPPITLENASQVSGLAEWYESSVSDVEWMPEERILAIANRSTINLYDITTRQILRTLYPQRDGIVDIAVNPSGRWLVSGMLRGSEENGYASSIELWRGPDWKPLGVLFGVNEGLTSMVFSPNGRFFNAAYTGHVSKENHVDFWNVSTWTITGTLQTGPAMNLAFSPDSNLLAISPDNYAIRIWDLKEQKFLYNLYTSFTGAVNALAFSPDGVTFASGHYDGTIRMWDLRTGVPFLTFSTEEVIQCLVFSPDGRLLATGGSFQNSLVRLWSAGTGKLLKTLEGHTSGVSRLSFSSDSQYLVSATYDGAIRLWGVRPY